MSKKTVVPNEVWADGRLTLWHLKVLGALYSFKGRGHEVWPTREKIAQRCGGMHPANVGKATADLVKMGWVSKVGGGGRGAPVHYILHVPACLQEPQTQAEAAHTKTLETQAESTHATTPQTKAEAAHATTPKTQAEETQETQADSAWGKELTNELTTAPEGAAAACAQPPAPACTHEPETASAQNAEPAFALQPDAPQAKPITQRQARVRGTFVTVERPHGVSEQVWADWIAHRRNLSRPVAITSSSMSYTYAEAKKAGISVEQALIYAMQLGWRNFTAAYFVNRVKGQIDAVAMADKSPLESDRDYRARKKMERVCPDIAAKPPALPVEAAALVLTGAGAAVPALAAPAADVVDVLPAPVASGNESVYDFLEREQRRIDAEKRQAHEQKLREIREQQGNGET